MRYKILEQLALHETGYCYGLDVSDELIEAMRVKYIDKTDFELFDVLMKYVDDRIKSIY